jgi:hypothetical protein
LNESARASTIDVLDGNSINRLRTTDSPITSRGVSITASPVASRETTLNVISERNSPRPIGRNINTTTGLVGNGNGNVLNGASSRGLNIGGGGGGGIGSGRTSPVVERSSLVGGDERGGFVKRGNINSSSGGSNYMDQVTDQFSNVSGIIFQD